MNKKIIVSIAIIILLIASFLIGTGFQKRTDVVLGELDTKGFYQPVYAFNVLWDDIEYTINIPAIQK